MDGLLFWGVSFEDLRLICRYGPTCKEDANLALKLANALGDTGVVQWNATLGTIKMWVSPTYTDYLAGGKEMVPTVAGTVTIAVPLERCGDDGKCETWDIKEQVTEKERERRVGEG